MLELPIHTPNHHHNHEDEHHHHDQVSHACIHDCTKCQRAKLQEDGEFERFIRSLIKFPGKDEAPVECEHTKVDLSCMFGGNDFAAGVQQKNEPTLVRVHDE